MQLLRELAERTLEGTDLPGLGRRIEGKVRDSYVGEKQRTIVVTDRVSCFDVVVGTLPLKGQVLNQAAAFWFEKTRELAPNHLLSVPDPCVSIVKEVEILPVEWVYRGYLTGVSSTSIWTAYEKGARDYCGHRLPDGLHMHERLAEPLLTPTTKAEQGEHDELTSRDEILRRGVISEELYDRAAALGHRLFAAGQAWAAQQGMILVDTKYELGLDDRGDLIVADEIHTPDSSRYWYADSYEAALQEGANPKSFDKEYVRRWLVEERGYRGDGPIPEIPLDVRCEAAARYIEAYEAVTGSAFEPNTEPPEARIRRNLGV
ncbi:MAG: phosphoribosylaminoimidazolesuccinocarboxamide synthase [Deltaproteobacteria bacterium]|nr:phosphoribosylaminoimidazolesuccinocarboxamide synthase [Deltaproteobacteria bacterium]MBW2394017.1 phosphoribosylaminoimidazolesuccinocarboxamide synthase [Deltaproteobacteria bacterium]